MTNPRIFAIAAVLLLGLQAPATSQARVTAAYEPLFINHAERLLERGEYARAVEVVTPHLYRLRTDRIAHQTYALLCRAYLLQGKHPAAEPACERAVGTRAASWSDYSNRGAVHFAKGDYAAALADFEQAARMNPDSHDVAHNLRAASRALGEPASRLAAQR